MMKLSKLKWHGIFLVFKGGIISFSLMVLGVQDPLQKNNHSILPVIRQGKFFNNHSESIFTHFIDALKIFYATKVSFNKYHTTNFDEWVQKDIPLATSDELVVQWIGHASFLIQVDGLNILTDPVFYDLHSILYPRKTPVGIDPENLPHIGCVIISHNHRDHLDEASMRILQKYQPTMLVPLGTKNWFISRGFKHVAEHNWWQGSIVTKKDGGTVECTFMPAVHWSGRHGYDAQTSLWGGWIIKSTQKTIYFAGDTGFNQEIFRAIKSYAQSIDCALLPVGPCEPRALMCHSHMSPQEAVDAFSLLNAKLFIPMHWGTFSLGPDSFDTPIKHLDEAWKKTDTCLLSKQLYKIKFGERIVIN